MQFDGQLPDEKVLVVFRRHPIVMRKGLILLSLAVVISAFIGLFLSRDASTSGELFKLFFQPLFIGIAVGLVCLFYYWIGWFYSVCIVTDQRFVQIQQKGLFKSRSVNDINLRRILSVNYEVQGIVETMLGFGTIIIQTMVGDFVIKKISKPAKTQVAIVSAINESGVELSEKVPEPEEEV